MVRNWFGDDGELNLMFLNVNEAIGQKREGLWKPFYISRVKRIDPCVLFIYFSCLYSSPVDSDL